jgi:hypothetical protein
VPRGSASAYELRTTAERRANAAKAIDGMLSFHQSQSAVPSDGSVARRRAARAIIRKACSELQPPDAEEEEGAAPGVEGGGGGG